jgi:DNA polymerase-3 subunit gamma/tau
MSETLYRKYRPQLFKEIIGQEHIKITLENEIESNKISHAYLFSGPRGIGKTTMARIFAKSINCKEKKDKEFEPCNECNSCKSITEGNNLDIVEIDAASNRGINEIRELRERIKYAPSNGEYKVFIIDEVHMLTIEAFNALLKTLEEPPKHAIFILATTELHKLPVTIVSRCERFDFKVIDIEKLKIHLMVFILLALEILYLKILI